MPSLSVETVTFLGEIVEDGLLVLFFVVGVGALLDQDIGDLQGQVLVGNPGRVEESGVQFCVAHVDDFLGVGGAEDAGDFGDIAALILGYPCSMALESWFICSITLLMLPLSNCNYKGNDAKATLTLNKSLYCPRLSEILHIRRRA